MDKILANWWQFSIIVIVLVIGIYLAGKSTESLLEQIKGILVTLAKEPIFKTASNRAASVNLIMLIFSGILAIALVVPNLLSQLGLELQEQNSYLITLGVFQFLAVGGGSGYFIMQFENQLPAFKDMGKQSNKEKKKTKDINKKKKEETKEQE